MKSYYEDKVEIFEDIFGSKNIVLKSDSLIVNDQAYPIVDDVIILSNPNEHTDYVKEKFKINKKVEYPTEYFSKEIQHSFGEEWKSYNEILPEHEKEFYQYFDLVELNRLKKLRVCDIGCGNGRWSYFLRNRCKELILVDFSDAIFTARKNLQGSDNCLFFMCDLKKLPFRENFADFLFVLGVLHHLPTSCLKEVRVLKKYAPTLLIFLYYALDNRPLYFRFILSIITIIRKLFSKIKNSIFRKLVSIAGTYFLYLPIVYIGRLFKPLVILPLFDFYHDKSAKRIQQDVYDRFFTSIEQRVSRKEILKLNDSFSEVIVSDKLPYWHFLCGR